MPAAVPLEHTSEIVAESEGVVEDIPIPTTSVAGPSNKPEAIVRPLRRREPSDDDNRSPDIEKLEAQIIQNLNKLEKSEKDYFRHSSEKKSKKNTHDVNALSESTDSIVVKRPLFVTTVPRGIFLPPQPIVREIVAKPRHIYAYASHPRILDQHIHQQSQHQRRREFLSKQNSINNTFNQFLHRNLISKNIRAFDELVETRLSHDNRASGSDDRVDEAGEIYGGISGVKITRTRENQQCQNLMFDRRVVRGSNYASSNFQPWNPNFAYAGLLSGKGGGDCDQARKEEEAKRRQLLRKRQVTRNQRNVIGTPPPVKGRKHEIIQTEKYLEELFARPPELEQSSQTDLFLQRPPTPHYVAAKVGVDVATEINEGELFDFDSEVQPILEALIGRTLQQALNEVIHEEEIAELKEQQAKMQAIREAELAELRRMEDKEKKLQIEKERRSIEDQIADEHILNINERITAAKLLQGHIADLLPSVLESIESVRNAENKEDLQQKLTPWLAEEVASEIGQMVDSEELLLEIVKEVLLHRAELYAKMEEDSDDT